MDSSVLSFLPVAFLDGKPQTADRPTKESVLTFSFINCDSILIEDARRSKKNVVVNIRGDIKQNRKPNSRRIFRERTKLIFAQPRVED